MKLFWKWRMVHKNDPVMLIILYAILGPFHLWKNKKSQVQICVCSVHKQNLITDLKGVAATKWYCTSLQVNGSSDRFCTWGMVHTSNHIISPCCLWSSEFISYIDFSNFYSMIIYMHITILHFWTSHWQFVHNKLNQ